MFHATHASILTSASSTCPSGHASLEAERSPTELADLLAGSLWIGLGSLAQPKRPNHEPTFQLTPAASVPGLSPVIFSARYHLTSELLRTL
jgi:hypothetical protein